MKALITGVSGFVGTHLSKALLDQNYEVYGISRSQPSNNEIKFYHCDIRDADKLEILLREINPDEIYHMAGPAYVPQSYENPIDVYNIIAGGTLNLYEAVKRLGLASKILYVGSAEVYGADSTHPFNESDLLRPKNPYAGAKACADIISQQYVLTYNLNIIRARPFNHTGPYQSANYVSSDFAKQVAECERSGRREVRVGNIHLQRDFLDVRDVIDAYLLLMRYGSSGNVYNVSSMKAKPISVLLDYLLMETKYNDWEIYVDPYKTRLKDITIRIGDNSKLIQETGWTQKYELSETMRDLLNYWRVHVQRVERG
ncbi:NAD-dependent epimerase/dehydratase [Paenibacillus algicola]|uniref:NAD-dependent epimerase/dehydratase n=1 Tax=Paenibacillus algicola TaxID=2565926 RepID=A0A4P8XRG4_9BACL|nr:GDP-mannose 4,6-dehydratase [Paenibacillus algicola]QCT04500.1 NAD-dependent epimerase/dehydratase [Paenibacillus algicola]